MYVRVCMYAMIERPAPGLSSVNITIIIKIKVKEKQKGIIYELECKKILTKRNSGVLKSKIKFDCSTWRIFEL